ncbi:MAG: ribosome maturation factor RimP [Chlorobium sp.]|uniref:ribosome maturation factor RimP n=1 Tax=Chlorobium sp. TaxID=1095 RepID=UPI0025C063C2|nr:ribosome maturation factor RimP [Chlorobium sp.]MCF8382601.1 ribosome maturation factor RimP [Chlorobium sp.]
MEEKIKRCVLRVLELSTGTKGEGVYLVRLQVKGSGKHRKIEVLLDSDTGIRIDQCSFFGRRIREQIEIDIEQPALTGEDFDLVVSSPGLGEPVLMPRQYIRHTGRLLKVVYKGEQQEEKEMTGRLQRVLKSGDTITALELVPVTAGKKSSGSGGTAVELVLERIVRAVPEVEW